MCVTSFNVLDPGLEQEERVCHVLQVERALGMWPG